MRNNSGFISLLLHKNRKMTPDAEQYSTLTAEQLEFLPALLEIEQTPPSPLGRALMWALMLLLVLALLWACWGQIEIVATAQGKLVPGSRVKTIQPYSTGEIKQIYVSDGQTVAAGDLLVAFDDTTATAELARLQKQQHSLQEDRTRLTTLLQWLQQDQASQLPEIGETQIQALQSSWQEYQAKQNSVQQQYEALTAQTHTTNLSIQRLEKTLPMVTEQAASLEKLLKDGLVARSQFLELEYQRVDQAELLNIEQAKRQQLNTTANEIQQQQQLLKAEYARQLNEQLNQNQKDLGMTAQELIKAEVTARQTKLTAPVAGVIEQLSLTTVGGVVTSAQPLMQLVPTAQELYAEAWVLNKDIGFVEAGQVAEIKLESFEFTKYGVIEAEVSQVSTDAVEIEGLGLVFPLKVKLKQHQLSIGNKKIPLSAGMTVTVEVKTGSRRVIEFLLSPLMKLNDESLRER